MKKQKKRRPRKPVEQDQTVALENMVSGKVPLTLAECMSYLLVMFYLALFSIGFVGISILAPFLETWQLVIFSLIYLGSFFIMITSPKLGGIVQRLKEYPSRKFDFFIVTAVFLRLLIWTYPEKYAEIEGLISHAEQQTERYFIVSKRQYWKNENQDHIRRIFYTTGELIEAIDQGQDGETLNQSFDKILQRTKTHFKEEETYYAKVGFPISAAQKAEHKTLIKELADLWREKRHVSSEAAPALHNWKENRLRPHINAEDILGENATKQPVTP